MKKRIIITINLPEEIRRELLSYEKRWDNLNVKWTNFYKMHLKFEFLGQVNKNGLEEIMIACQETATQMKPFKIRLSRIGLGPDPIEPKMILAAIHQDENVMQLRDIFNANLLAQGFEFEKLAFKPYIVIARARGNQLKGRKTNLVLKNLQFEVLNIDVQESQLSQNLEKHKLLKTFEFQ